MERNTNTLYILRFIAALMVVWYHFAPTSNFFIINGGEAVNFFFFISGYVMVIANSKYFNNKNSHFSKSKFYIKRFARIYPLYFLALLSLAIFHYFIKTIDTSTVKYRLIFEVLGIERWLYSGSFNFPGWTISCEFFFYLMFPIAFVYMRKHMARFQIFAWTYYVLAYLITICLFFLNQAQLPKVLKFVISGLHLNPIFLISIFLLGMLSGKVFIENKISFFKNKRNCLLSVLVCIAIIFGVKSNVPHYVLEGGLLSPVYFLLVIAITSFSKKDTVIFDSRIFLFLGDISYSIYILQAPVVHYYTQYIAPIKSWTGAIAYTLALISFCSVTYYIFEVPFKNYILNHLKKRRALKEKDLAIL